MRNTAVILLLLFLVVVPALKSQNESNGLYKQLEEVNKYWKTNGTSIDLPSQKNNTMLSEKSLIQTHLQIIEKTLREKDVAHLTEAEKENRLNSLDILHQYWENGVFPKNLYHKKRTPYFIDDFQTACAVGHLIIKTGGDELAKTISQENNYGYIHDLVKQYPEINNWSKENGFTIDELAWIQPCYQSPSCPTCAPGTVINVTCNGNTDGCAAPDPASDGMISPYSYNWGGSCGITTESADCLAAGIYSCTVIDAISDTMVYSFTITEPPALTLMLDSIGDAHCGQSDGYICVSGDGGTPPHTYQWNPSVSSGPCANNIPAGCYSVTVTDNNGCIDDSQFCINDIAGPTVTLHNADDVTCAGFNDGLISFDIIGGTTPYDSLYWVDGANNHLPQYNGSQTADSLSGGNYGFIVIDAAGCTASGTANIFEPSPLGIDIDSVNVTCYGGSGGEATAAVVGGITPYTYSWNTSPPQTTSQATGLIAGTYTVEVIDSTGCELIDSVTITQPSAITFNLDSLSDAYCGQNNGYLCVSASGGTPPYVFHWGIGITTACTDSIPAGSFSVTATDANGCSSDSVYNINDIDGPTIVLDSVRHVTCSGYSDGMISFSIIGGTPPFDIEWIDGGNNSMPEYDDSMIADSLPGGTYGVVFTDSAGCIATASTYVYEPPPLSNTMDSSSATCFENPDGQATATVTGGVTPYYYNWNTSPTQTTPVASALYGGTYEVQITDSHYCQLIDSVIIGAPDQVSITAGDEYSICPGDTTVLFASATGGNGGFYSYNWSNGATTDSISVSASSDAIFTVSATDTSNCSATDTIILSIFPFITLDVTPDTIINPGDSIQICANASAVPPITYSWSNGSIDSCQWVSPAVSQTYIVTVTDSCGQTVDAVFIEVNEDNGLNALTHFPSFTIYPNPTHGLFTVYVDNATSSSPVQVRVIDLLGKTVPYRKSRQGHDQILIWLEASPGIYFVQIETVGGAFTKRVVVTSK